MKFIVYASKNEIITRHADFTVIAKDEKEAIKKITDELNQTCLSERLALDNEYTEKKESKIFAIAEEPDDFNKNDFEKSEFVCTCGVENTQLLKLSGLSKKEIKDYFNKISEEHYA